MIYGASFSESHNKFRHPRTSCWTFANCHLFCSKKVASLLRPVLKALQGAIKLRVRVHLLTLFTFISLLGMEFIAFLIADYFDGIWILFVAAPLILLTSVVFWMHKITSINCTSCGKPYGVLIGIECWPSFPPKCQSCGSGIDAL